MMAEENESSGGKKGTVDPPDIDVSEEAVHVDTKDVDVTDVKPKEDQSDEEDDRERTPEPDPDEKDVEETKEQAKKIDEKYKADARESVVLPGTDGTVSGTAIADWLDDEGNIIDPDERDAQPQVDQSSDDSDENDDKDGKDESTDRDESKADSDEDAKVQ